jgi:hypothetical protein
MMYYQHANRPNIDAESVFSTFEHLSTKSTIYMFSSSRSDEAGAGAYLWRHVVGRADARLKSRRLAERVRQTEIGNLHSVARFVDQQHILGLQASLI